MCNIQYTNIFSSTVRNYKNRYLDNGQKHVILKNYFSKDELESYFDPFFNIFKLPYFEQKRIGGNFFDFMRHQFFDIRQVLKWEARKYGGEIMFVAWIIPRQLYILVNFKFVKGGPYYSGKSLPTYYYAVIVWQIF